MKLTIQRSGGKLRIAISSEVKTAEHDVPQIQKIHEQLAEMGFAEIYSPLGGYHDIFLPLDASPYVVTKQGKLTQRHVPSYSKEDIRNEINR